MAAPSIPANLYVTQGNGQVQLNWDLSPGATTYPVLRSVDGVTYASIATPAINAYTDTSVTVGTMYYYKVQASDGINTSSASNAVQIVPALSGNLSLFELRQKAQERADRVNSNFVSTAEWNGYINQSAYELYDLLTTVYEDYNVASPYTFVTDGSNARFNLPTDFYKLLGVDCGLSASDNARVTINKFDFIQRNQYVYPNVTSTYFGVFNLRYRLVGNKLMFIPTPSAGQYITVWYVPRLTQLLKETDMLEGVSGWTEYVICDAAIKALQKEESDVSVLMAEKQMLKQRIEESSINRDAGQPDTISPTRDWVSRNGGGWSNGSFGGF